MKRELDILRTFCSHRHNFTVKQVAIMYLLYRYLGGKEFGLDFRQIAIMLHISKASLSRSLDALGILGFIHRRRGADRRTIRVLLTPNGLKFIDSLLASGSHPVGSETRGSKLRYILYIKGKPYNLVDNKLHVYASRASALLSAGEGADIREVEIIYPDIYKDGLCDGKG